MASSPLPPVSAPVADMSPLLQWLEQNRIRDKARRREENDRWRHEEEERKREDNTRFEAFITLLSQR